MLLVVQIARRLRSVVLNSTTLLAHHLFKGIQEIRRPPHAGSASATVLFADGRGKATVNFVYNGKMTDTIFTFPSSTTTLAAYTLLGGIISYDVTPWATVYVRGENVFDSRYEEVYSYRSPGAGVYAGLKVRTN